MATKKKSSRKSAGKAGKATAGWADTIKAALEQKKGRPGWPAEDRSRSHASQSAAHSKLGRRNPR